MDIKEFIRGCHEFEKHEKRDAMYKMATFILSHFWGKHSEMADGLGVLLLTWNQAFYRYGTLDFDKLEKCIADNFSQIESFRKRDISSFSDADKSDIKALFLEFLEALQITVGKVSGRKSPVSVAKALYLLAPNFFPLWDDKIARAYKCYYSHNPDEKYIRFCELTKALANEIRENISQPHKTIVKLIDEYNYSKYTKGWI